MSANDLANLNAPPDQVPRAPLGPPAVDLVMPAHDVPVVHTTGLNAAQLARPLGTPKPALYGTAYGFGMTGLRPHFTGDHAYIAEDGEPPNMTGGQEAWRSWNPRTMRHMPTTPWDDGVYQGGHG